MRLNMFHLLILAASLCLGHVGAMQLLQVPNQQAGTVAVVNSLSGIPKLFSEPTGGVLPAAAIPPPPATGPNGRIAMLAQPGGGEQPAIKTVSINIQMLASTPRRMALDVPGVNLVVTRRADLTPAPSVATASGSTPGPVTTWVGEVLGAKGPASSVILVTSENGGVYGKITFLDRRTKTRRTFTISLLLEDGVDTAAVASAPNNVATAAAANLYPNIDTTRHVVMEVTEPDYDALYRADELMTPPQGAEASATTQDTIDTTPDLSARQSLPAYHAPLQPPQDAQALAEAVAASAGTPNAVADDYLAAATAWMQAQAAGGATVTTAAAAPSAAPEALNPTAQSDTTAAASNELPPVAVQNTNTIHDMLAVYTPAAAAASGGEAGIQNLIRVATAEMNKIYADSRVTITVNLVGMRQINYVERDETGNAIMDDAVAGAIPNLNTTRNQLGADIVTLWSKGGCGLGFVDTGHGYAFAQLGTGCMTGFVLTHEVGHVGGCEHHARTDTNTKPYAFGFNRCDQGKGNFNTIISPSCDIYDVTPHGFKIPLFSDPSLSWNGVPAGNATNAHCARALMESRTRIAGYRNTMAATVTAGRITSGLSATKCINAPNTNLGTQVTLQDCTASNNNQRLELLPDGSLHIVGTNRCLDVRNGGTNLGLQRYTSYGFHDQLRRLHPYNAPDKCLQTPSTANGALLSLATCSTATGQTWTSATPGVLPQQPVVQDARIQSTLNDRLCLDVYAFNYANQAPILTYWCNGANNQKWQLDRDGLIRSTHNPAKCMAADNANNGAPVDIFDCSVARTNQRWFVDRFSRLRPYHAPTKCLDIMSANQRPEARVQLWDCYPVRQQTWIIWK